MKNIFLIIITLCALLLSSCVTEEALLKNHVFIDESNLRNEVRIALDDGQTEAVRKVRIAMSDRTDRNVKVILTKAPELIGTFREAYSSPDAELLPDICCDFESAETTIRKGDVTAESISVRFHKLDELDLYSKEYILPMVMSAEGTDVLEGASKIYFVIKKASLVNMVADINGNCAWPEWGDFEKVGSLEALTMECLINCHSFNNKSSVHTVMGIEDHFLLRIGDVNKPKNFIHLAAGYDDRENNTLYRRSIPGSESPQLLLKTNRWYHVAVTFEKGFVRLYLDGVLRAEGDISELYVESRPEPEDDIVYGVNTVRFMVPHSDEDNQPRCFWVGYSCEDFKKGEMKRCLDGMIAEARIWGRALSKEEINEDGHFYKIYPDKKTGEYDPDLLAYWKFDDGEGKVIKDYSRYGHNLTGFNDFLWYPTELPKNN